MSGIKYMCSVRRHCFSFVFFFSSRRRHTRWNCDWSSDVCSSDLPTQLRPLSKTELCRTVHVLYFVPVSVSATRSKYFHCAVLVDRKSTRLNSSHSSISYAVFCLKKKKK